MELAGAASLRLQLGWKACPTLKECGQDQGHSIRIIEADSCIGASPLLTTV